MPGFKQIIISLLSIHIFTGVICFEINDNNTVIARAIFNSCSNENFVLPCLAGKFANTIDRATNWDVKLFDGFTLTKNSDVIVDQDSRRSQLSGFSSLRASLYNFLDSHVLTLDLTEARARKDGGGGYGFGKVGKKDKKYLYYALTAVTGIFGLSVPIILKGLALLAGKALLASKAALIIIGSIALKKIFQSDKKDGPPVKVHTHTVPLDDDHDRYFDTSGYQYNTI